MALKNRPARSYSDTVTRHQVEEELKVAGRLDSASSNTGAEAENNDSLGRTQSADPTVHRGMRKFTVDESSRGAAFLASIGGSKASPSKSPVSTGTPTRSKTPVTRGAESTIGPAPAGQCPGHAADLKEDPVSQGTRNTSPGPV